MNSRHNLLLQIAVITQAAARTALGRISSLMGQPRSAVKFENLQNSKKNISHCQTCPKIHSQDISRTMR